MTECLFNKTPNLTIIRSIFKFFMAPFNVLRDKILISHINLGKFCLCCTTCRHQKSSVVWWHKEKNKIELQPVTSLWILRMLTTGNTTTHTPRRSTLDTSDSVNDEPVRDIYTQVLVLLYSQLLLVATRCSTPLRNNSKPNSRLTQV